MSDIVVVDTSVALKWVLAEPDSEKALRLLHEWLIAGTMILAPSLMMYEVANALYKRVRKGTLSLDRAREALAEVFIPQVELDVPVDVTLSERAVELARQYGLSAAYDAHYVALAERERCELWTADERLWNSVRAHLSWVRWLGSIT